MDQTAFYGVVSAINFTLLGLWWIAAKDRGDVGPGFRRMAYFVSLQFAIPATVALLAQVAPDVPEIWRWSFALAGVTGVVGALLLATEMRAQTESRTVPALFAVIGIPLYVLVVIVALSPGVVADAGLDLKPIEAEGLLLAILVFVGVQEAWFVHMTPGRSETSS